MSLPSNQVEHMSGRSRSVSPRRHRIRQTHDISEYETVRTPRGSGNTPSIVELENLHMERSGEFSVRLENEGRGSLPPLTHGRRKPIQAFQPQVTSRFEGRKKTTVYVAFVFLKIGQVETIKEYFEADVFLQARWREPALDNTTVKVKDFREYWTPQLVLQNIFEDPKEKVWHEVRLKGRGEAYIYEMRRIKGKFFEKMELNTFPFDVQSISLVLSSELTNNKLEIVEDMDEVSCIYVDCFSDSQEWELHNFVELEPLEISAQYTRDRKNYPGLVTTCCVSRRSGFFAWNVLVIVNLLSIFAFTTFAVDPTLTQNRLQLSFILILAGISFRFVTNQSMPKISYLTHLDRYVLISMMFAGFICFWHAVVSRFKYDVELQNTLDFAAFIVFLIFFFVYNVGFIILMVYQNRRNIQEIRNREKKFESKAFGVMGELWTSVKENVSAPVNFLSRIDKTRAFIRHRHR
ncbi:uncharacterized protein LOC128228793 [Mya arenaria]|uniref:uncharacterized protein LOC128228793 n=1 Tax=Mya arenaria TaxID=6604 RepID=UPI0022E27E97|nr:uncharacterized protein LOC128228793 [Mya arenaria]XP_052796255.1 uncharacterized protein LOC128228793 [Mya arenaria]